MRAKASSQVVMSVIGGWRLRRRCTPLLSGEDWGSSCHASGTSSPISTNSRFKIRLTSLGGRAAIGSYRDPDKPGAIRGTESDDDSRSPRWGVVLAVTGRGTLDWPSALRLKIGILGRQIGLGMDPSWTRSVGPINRGEYAMNLNQLWLGHWLHYV